MEHVLVSGVVQELTITKGYEDLAFTDQGKSLVGLAAVVAASTGNMASSAILSNSSGGAEVNMEFFVCTINNLPLRGRFHKVDFSNGDHIEFVVTISDGIGSVHGARDPKQRFIWTVPYQTRGNVAQKASDISSSLTISAICAVLCSVLIFYNTPPTIYNSWSQIGNMTAIFFLAILAVNFLSRRPFYKFSFEATKVFAAFGYDDPARVNLPKQHSQADKAYCKETGEPRSWDKPWRYRYQEIPLNKEM